MDATTSSRPASWTSLDTKEYDLVSGKTCITKPAKIEDIQYAVAGLIREIGFGTA